MRNLRRDIGRVSQGRSLHGTVIAWVNDKVDVDLGHGRVIRGIQFVGGPLERGKRVLVDWASGRPVASSMGETVIIPKDPNAKLRSMRPDPDLGAMGAGGIVVYHAAGGETEGFPITIDGLQAALSAANAYDIVHLPPGDYIGDITVPENVSLIGLSREQCIIYGMITLKDKSAIENLSVDQYAETLGEDVIGVLFDGDASYDIAAIYNCYIRSRSLLSPVDGTSVGVQSGPGFLTIRNSHIIAASSEGSIAVYALGGTPGAPFNSTLIEITHSAVDGSPYCFSTSDLGRIEVFSTQCEWDWISGEVVSLPGEGPLSVDPHAAVTVSDTATINLSLSGQDLSADVLPDGILLSALSSGSAPSGYIIVSDGLGGLGWEEPTTGSGSGASELSDLTDVTISSPTDGQVLKYSSGSWINGTDNSGSSAGGGLLIGTAYLADVDAHTTDNTFEAVNSMSVTLVPSSTATLMCTFTAAIKMNSTSWEHYHYRFVLDGETYSESWRRERDTGANTTNEFLDTMHTVFSDVAAGSHTITVEWASYSGLDVQIYERRLTVMAIQ